MEFSLLLAEQIAALFLMGVVGFVLVKGRLLTAQDSKIISVLVVYVCSPCVTVDAFQIAFTKSKAAGLLLAFAVAIIVHIIFIFLMRVLKKPLGLNSIERMSATYTNCGYILVPIVLGTMGQKWVFYTSAYVVVYTVLVWTHGAALLCKGESGSLKKVLTNPNIIAVIIGVVMFSLKIQFPTVIGECVSGFAKMVGPASMLVIGMLIGNVDLKGVFRQKRVYLLAFIRLILMPIVIIFLIKFSGAASFHPQGHQIMLIVVLAASAPPANMITQMAQVYGKDAQYASVINTLCIILCMITMPVISLVYEMVV